MQYIESLLAKTNEVYQDELARLEQEKGGKAKSTLAVLRGQALFGLEGSSFCKAAPDTIKAIEGEINTFSWFIPDKVEIPAQAFLKTVDFLLTQLCGAAAGPAKPRLKTNVSQKAR